MEFESKNICIIFTIFLFFIIILFPLVIRSQVWIDEILDSAVAYNLAFKNRFSLDVLGDIKRLDKVFFVRPPIYSFILSYLYKIFGFKRIVTLALSFIPIVLCFCLTYFISQLLFKNIAISILSSFLFGLSPIGIYLAKAGRADALALFFFSLSLILLLIFQNYKDYWRRIILLFCGLLFSLSVQTYQLYLILFGGYIYYFLFELRSKYKDWFNDMFLFLLSFFLPLFWWLSFVLKNFKTFKEQFLWNFSIATNLNEISRIISSLFSLKIILSDSSYFILIFIIPAVIFVIRNYSEYKNIFIGFFILPIIGLIFLNLLKGYYIQIILPTGFMAAGVFIYRLYKWSVNKKYLRASIYLFVLFYTLYGLGIRYFITIKDWQIRSLPDYEEEIFKVIPTRSTVLGNPEDWYAVTNIGSQLLLIESIESASFDWDKIDYIILPLYRDIPKNYPYLYDFIKNRCELVTTIGKKGYTYTVLDEFSRFSGYKSAIYKVKNK
jgi:4-amino-4-deoxy-L-arabinose transferase-like glycosyltransferase